MRKILITIFVLIVYAGDVYSQDTLRLSFREAVRIGLAQNQDFRIMKNEQEILQMERLNARLRHLPTVNFNSNMYRQIGQQFQQVEGELIVTDVSNDLLSPGLNVNIPIYNGGRRLNMTMAARSFEEAGKLGLERGAQTVMFDIAQLYLQVLLDRELYEIALENLENQKQQLLQIEGFVEAGIRTLSDQYNQQSEVARLETVALDARITWETDLWQLAEALQLDSNTIPELEPVTLEKEVSDYLSLPLEELYQTALHERKDYQQQILLESGNKKMLTSSKWAMYPQINAFFNYSTFYTSLDERTVSTQLFQVYPTRSIGFNLSIPIFNNFDNRLSVTRSKVAYNNQQLEKSALERRISQETKLAYENFRAAIKREEATRLQLSAAEESQKIIAERFKLGVSDFVDLAQANQQLVTAQSDYAQSLYTLYFQEIILQFTLGVLEVDE